MKVAFIPARCGSKSIKFKNLQKINGTSLLHRAIRVAKQADIYDKVIVSTDCEKIERHALELKGVTIHKRSSELSNDSALVSDAILSYLEQEKQSISYLSLIEPTAPLRKPEDLRRVMAMCEDKEFDSVATFTEADVNPHRVWKINNHRPETFIDGANPWLPRQELPSAYQLNGICYTVNVSKYKRFLVESGEKCVLFGNAGAVIIPKERSVDIDSEFELKLAELIINEYEK